MEKQLLYQYFIGQATLLEKSRIEEWLKDEENQEYFFQILEEWERNNAQYIPDKDALWRIIDRKAKPQNKKNQLPPKQTKEFRIQFSRRVWIMAASILLIIVSGYLFSDIIVYKNYTTSYGETLNIKLTDHSEIVLNANSTLKVPRGLHYMAAREVWVKGEALFKISRTTDLKKFLVHTTNTEVEVLGTRFNVNDRGESTRVVLQEGSVKVVSRQEKNDVVFLEKPGDFAEVTNKNRKIVKKSVDETLFTSWAEHRLKFDNASLPHVIKSIEDYYGISISTPDSSLLDRKFTGTLPNDNMDVIIQALSNIYKVNFIIKEK